MKWEKVIIALVSAAFAVILFILLPVESSKYRLKLEGEDSRFTLQSYSYSDLDGDGESEKVRFKKRSPVPAITVEKANGEIVNQWNLNGEWLDLTKPEFSDYDHDGFREIVAFTYHQDSIWLHILEPLQPEGTVLHLPLARVELYNSQQDWRVYFGRPEDFNGDQNDEYYFSIRAGFTLQPRNLYLFDVKNKELQTHEALVGNNISWPFAFDIDQDGIPEISGKMGAPANLEGKDAYISDTCSWLLIYDRKLQFKVDPIAYQGSPSYLYVLPMKKGEHQFLVSSFHAKENGEIINKIEVREWVRDSLQLISQKSFSSDSQIQLISIDQQNDGEFFIIDGNFVFRLNHLLEEKHRMEVEGLLFTDTYFPMDLNGDGLTEHVFYSDFSKLSVFQSDFSHGVEIDLGYMESFPVLSCFTKERTHFVNVYRGHQNVQLSYSKNPFYPIRFLIIFLSFLAYYLIFSLLLRFQRKQIEARQESEKQILHYQLTNVMQQLDPHFLFNALSNISSYYHKGEQEHAQSYLAKVSRLVRTSLENSERMTITLEEELAFVKDYLTVEQMRMGDRLDFSIEVDERIQQELQVPKMLIQNFVENAVKHGIRHLSDRKGLIRVFSVEENGYFQIHVEDNGIGREKANEIGSFGTGKGLKMIEKTLNIFEKLEKVRIVFKIEDLTDQQGLLAGTKVILRIPIHYN